MNFILNDKRDMSKFLGIEIKQLDENIFIISQPFLIDRIISFITINTNNYCTENNDKSTPVGNTHL